MATWMITTGSNDVKLKNEKQNNWGKLWDKLYPSKSDSSLPPEVKNERDHFIFKGKKLLSDWLSQQKDNKELLSLPPRILGLVYKDQRDYYEDLAFPLLDKFINFFEENQSDYEFPKRIIIFLTDQKAIFTEEKQKTKDSPFLSDTCYLEPLIEWFIKEKKGKTEVELIFKVIEPKLSDSSLRKGIDHWEEMLDNVGELLKAVEDREETIYVSHQAGTPAISSAVQFNIINQFSKSKIQFLIGNIYEDKNREDYQAELIEISRYWQSAQMQKAKALITKGNVGAAKILLEELNLPVPEFEKQKLDEYVNLFNLKLIDSRQQEEFGIEQAFNRVRKSLDLIEIFFRNENYLPGITLISAAQETFMKAAIVALVRVRGMRCSVGGVKLDQLIAWNEKGLLLKSKTSLQQIEGFNVNSGREQNLSPLLCFPQPERINGNEDRDYRNFKKYICYQFTLGNICPDGIKAYGNNNNLENWHFELANFRLLLWLTELIKDDDNLLNNVLNDVVKDEETKNSIERKKVSPENWQWELLKWSCDNNRPHEQDRRNQLMHNLQGVQKKDILKYLYGNPPNPLSEEQLNQNVENVYKNEVKKRFVEVLSFVQALYSATFLHKTELKDDHFEENSIDRELKEIVDRLP
jgi:hypothetical protein